MQQRVILWCALPHVGKNDPRDISHLTTAASECLMKPRDPPLPFLLPQSHTHHPCANPGGRPPNAFSLAPMWLKSNAITNLAHDLHSSDPEIARAAPRRFALAQRCPRRLPRLVKCQCGKLFTYRKGVGKSTFCLGRMAKALKGGIASIS